MRKMILVAASAALLSGCALTPSIDVCKGASTRRATYTAAIYAVDALTATGRPVPKEALLARDAAVLALTLVNRNCPEPAPAG